MDAFWQWFWFGGLVLVLGTLARFTWPGKSDL